MAEKCVIVFSESPFALKEILGKAKTADAFQGWKVVAMPWGNAAAAVTAGADEVCLVKGAQEALSNSKAGAKALAAAVKEYQPAAVLYGATKLGMEIASRAAESTNAGYATWVVDFGVNPANSAVTAKSQMYNGVGIASVEFKSGVAFLGIAPGVFEAVELSGSPAVKELAVEFGVGTLKILEMKEKAATGARLEEAKLVVDVGQGVKEKADLAMIEELAASLDGQTACSRPVASDRDWFPEWLGLSGKKIKPELCLTLGISGSIQHIVGIRESRLIASVNSDENAGIFSQADYGIIGDLYEFLPAFKERLQARGVKPAWK